MGENGISWDYMVVNGLLTIFIGISFTFHGIADVSCSSALQRRQFDASVRDLSSLWICQMQLPTAAASARHFSERFKFNCGQNHSARRFNGEAEPSIRHCSVQPFCQLKTSQSEEELHDWTEYIASATMTRSYIRIKKLIELAMG